MSTPPTACIDGPKLRDPSGRWRTDGLVVQRQRIQGWTTSPHAHTQRLRLPDGFAFPGWIDSHAHLGRLGANPADLSFSPTDDLSSVIDHVAARAARSQGWICGRGWLYLGQPTPPQPTRLLLDPITPHHPIALRRADEHALWVNSAALLAAGITPQTPDPPGGQIVREADGTPTGLLIDAAMGLVLSKVPPPTAAALDAMVLAECSQMLAQGITCVHEMATDADLLASLERLAAQGRLPLRVRSFLWAADARLRARINAGIQRGVGGDEVFRCVGLKLFSDGALGSRGARLSRSYPDGSRGVQPDSDALIAQTIEDARLCGWQVAVHAIGDAAVLEVAKRLAAHQPPRARWRIEHVQIAPWAALEIMAKAGLGAAVQPIHAAHDLPWAYDLLGPSLAALAYPWRRLQRLGLKVGFGSDHPIESPSVTDGIFAATRRRAHANTQSLPGAAEVLTRAEALRCYGPDAAHLTFDEGALGHLHPGFACDLSVWDRDLSACPSHELCEARCLATVVGGQIVWQAN